MRRDIETGTDELLCHVANGVGVITLNRPAARNALSRRLSPALRRMIALLAHDDEVGAILVTGAGGAFCAGGDVKSMASDGGAPVLSPEQRVTKLIEGQARMTGALWQVQKPTLAALPGPAAGAGLALALACDMRIAAQSAFVTTGYSNIGLSGDYGVTWFLTQLVGVSKAMELLYLAERLEAAACLELGLVNRVVPDDELMDEALALARRLADRPRNALAFMKAHVHRAALGTPLDACLEHEARAIVELSDGDEFKQTVKAFAARMGARKSS